MECTFDQGKLELEAECVVRPSFFESCLDRLKDFMWFKPPAEVMSALRA